MRKFSALVGVVLVAATCQTATAGEYVRRTTTYVGGVTEPEVNGMAHAGGTWVGNTANSSAGLMEKPQAEAGNGWVRADVWRGDQWGWVTNNNEPAPRVWAKGTYTFEYNRPYQQ